MFITIIVIFYLLPSLTGRAGVGLYFLLMCSSEKV